MPTSASHANCRLLAAALHDGAELTLEEIAALLHVTVRTARRTIRALEQEGVPVRERRDGRYKRFYLREKDRLARRERLPPPELTERELLALAVSAEAAAAALRHTPLAEPLSAAFRKLMESYESFSFEAEEVPARWFFGSLGQSKMDPRVFATVAEAVSMDRSLRIRYTSREGKTSWNRLVDPYLIAEVGGSWLLVAFCHYSGHVINFAIAAISEAELADPFVERQADFSPDLYFRDAFRVITGPDGYTVRFSVAPDKAASFLRKAYHPTQQIEEEGPDGLVVSFEVAALDEVAAFLRSFGPGIVVSEPPELAERLRAEAAQVVEEYGRSVS
jgi:predicted DNA-binding transcriptional regulator YafY